MLPGLFRSRVAALASPVHVADRYGITVVP